MRLVQVPPVGRSSASGLAVVREATRHSHGHLEAGFVARPWDAVRHAHLLERLLGLHLPLEAALDRLWLAGDLEVSWPPRRRAHLIRADLRAIGRTPAQVAAAPRCPGCSLPTTPTQAWGVLYVLDGATLGGAVIRRTAIAAGSRPRPAARCGGRPGRRPAGGRRPGPSTPCRRGRRRSARAGRPPPSTRSLPGSPRRGGTAHPVARGEGRPGDGCRHPGRPRQLRHRADPPPRGRSSRTGCSWASTRPTGGWRWSRATPRSCSAGRSPPCWARRWPRCSARARPTRSSSTWPTRAARRGGRRPAPARPWRRPRSLGGPAGRGGDAPQRWPARGGDRTRPARPRLDPAVPPAPPGPR